MEIASKINGQIKKEKEKEAIAMPREGTVVTMDWSDYEAGIETLAWKLKQHQFMYKDMLLGGIYGIPRGGLVAAVLLSHITGIPLHLEPWHNSLILDDIADTGLTLSPYTACATAAILVREDCAVQPWLSAGGVAKNIHIKFPYETMESTYNGRGGL